MPLQTAITLYYTTSKIMNRVCCHRFFDPIPPPIKVKFFMFFLYWATMQLRFFLKYHSKNNSKFNNFDYFFFKFCFNNNILLYRGIQNPGEWLLNLSVHSTVHIRQPEYCWMDVHRILYWRILSKDCGTMSIFV